jgi:hypothetical protein
MNPYLEVEKENPYLAVKKENPYLAVKRKDRFFRLRTPKESYQLLKELWGKPWQRTWQITGEEAKEGVKDIGGALKESTTDYAPGTPKEAVRAGRALLGGLRTVYSPVTGITRAWLGEPAKRLAEKAGTSEGIAKAIGVGAELAPQVIAPGGLVRKSLPQILPLVRKGKAITETVKVGPVEKIIQALKEAKPIRKGQEVLYSGERAKRIGKVVAVGKRVPGEKGYYAQLGQLKDPLPKMEFESIRGKVAQADIDELFNIVEKSHLLPYEKITTKGGLAKLLGEKGGAVPTKNEIELLTEVFPGEFIKEILSKRPVWQKIKEGAAEVINVPRALMATFDLSAPLRQGMFLIGRPKQFIPAFKDMFKYFFSPKTYQGLMEGIQARPTYKLMRESKLSLTSMGRPLTAREERFMSNLAERIPAYGAVIRASNRAYSGFLNKLRADVFDDLVKRGKELGLSKTKTTRSIAKFVNSATGRGDLGVFNKVAVVLNGMFFSPRLMASRLNLLNPSYYVKLHPFVRREALKSLFTFAGTGLTTLTLAKLNGAEVGMDPRSADFGKIKIGNIRFDVWGGFQQYIRLAGQLISGKLISTTTGREYTLGEGYRPTTRLDIIYKFFESKEAPILSFATRLVRGQGAFGEPLDIPAETANRMISMVIQDMYDLAKEGGLKDVPWAIPAIFGVGTQTYGRQIPALELTPSGKPTVRLRPVSGMGEDFMHWLRGTKPTNIPERLHKPLVKAKETERLIKYTKEKAKKDYAKMVEKNPYLAVGRE